MLTFLRPQRSCDITVREASARVLPGLETKIWGYNGLFPGPVIEARRSHPLTLRLANAPPVPILNHLHGGRTPPESHGYPTDFVPPGVARECSYPNIWCSSACSPIAAALVLTTPGSRTRSISPPGEVARILVNFSGYRGRYVFHCHNLEHEDVGMMANFEVI